MTSLPLRGCVTTHHCQRDWQPEQKATQGKKACGLSVTEAANPGFNMRSMSAKSRPEVKCTQTLITDERLIKVIQDWIQILYMKAILL